MFRLMIKKILFTFLFLIYSILCYSQAPSIQWAKCLGGTESDRSYSVIQTDDGGYVIAGVTLSPNGDVTGLHSGLDDMWIIKLDSLGGMVWKKCLGGSVAEGASAIRQTFDGGFIISGYATSNDFDVAGGGFNGPLEDYWIVKTDSQCNIQWQKCFGGTSLDWAKGILQTRDSNFVIAGWAESTDGGIDTSYGGADAWIIKYNNTGNLLWKKMYGGSASDYIFSITESNTGSLYLAGMTTSNDINVNGNHGGEDAWALKLDANGNLVWQKCIGGSAGDALSTVIMNSIGQIVLIGGTVSNDGDITGNHGSGDALVVVLDTSGSIIWQNCYGGFGGDGGNSGSFTSDSGLVLAIGTNSYDNFVTCNNGLVDFYILKLDSIGNIQWDKCLGGTQDEEPLSIIQTRDQGYIISGYTLSNDFDVSGNHSAFNEWDIWVVKLAPLGLEIEANEKSIDYVVRFNSLNNLDISFYSDYSEDLSVQIFDLAGKLVLDRLIKTEAGVNKKNLKTQYLSAGFYFVRLVTKHGSVTKKISLSAN